MGDSFTEGDGAPADSAYPVLLEHLLLKDSLNVEVMNAGVSGSDPFFELNLLNNQLIKFQPNIVIFSLSRQDFLEDIAVRGGLERFDPATGKKTSLKEYLFAYSHVSRLVFYSLGYSWLLVKEDKDLLEDLKTDKIPELIQEMDKIKVNQPTIETFVFLYPQKYNFTNEGHGDLEDCIITEMQKSDNFYFSDLIPCYQDKIEQDQLPWERYYWKIDGHHNSLGYELKARCIYKVLQSHMIKNQHQ